MDIPFFIFISFMYALPVFFFVAVFVIWLLWVRLRPAKSDMIKIKFDYNSKQTAFYSKGVVIAAVLFWLFLLLVGITMSNPQTTTIILSLVGGVYMIFIIRYFVTAQKINRQKKTAQKIPGKIVGIKEYTSSHYSYKNNKKRQSWHANLIVEYENPYTFQTEEYITKEEVNCNPFYYLKSLDVTVYYQDAEHIWVEDFKRIDSLLDNIAYQVTGKVDGKDPGVLRYETKEEK